VAHGDAVTAPILRELVELIGVDGEALQATVAEFDRHAADGRDPQFGRGEAGWDRWRKYDTTYPNPALAPLGDAGPFHAQQIVPRCFGTRGGPVTGEHARIVDLGNAPIPGLYGAGNAVVSPFGHSYPGGGGTLAPAVTFGYLAGESLTNSATG
jgi:3-oxosteroid 1-dehydrogenase